MFWTEFLIFKWGLLTIDRAVVTRGFQRHPVHQIIRTHSVSNHISTIKYTASQRSHTRYPWAKAIPDWENLIYRGTGRTGTLATEGLDLEWRGGRSKGSDGRTGERVNGRPQPATVPPNACLSFSVSFLSSFLRRTLLSRKTCSKTVF